jgi:lactoylglutathione lyase
MTVSINGFQHLGIPVINLVRSIAFYERLGFENIMTSPFEMNGENGSVSMMKRSNMIIELYQLPEKELAGIKNRNNGHIDHIAFDVDDIDSTFATLQNDSFNIIEERPVFLPFWDNGCKYFNILGPDGERLEFNQIL